MRVVDFSPEIFDVKGEFRHLDFPHGDDGIEYGFGYMVTVFAYFLYEDEVLVDFISEQIPNQSDMIGPILFFGEGGIDEQLIVYFAVFRGIVEVGDFQEEGLVFELSCLGIEPIKLAAPQKQLHPQQTHLIH